MPLAADSSSSAASTGLPTYWWFNGIDSLLFGMIAVAAALRLWTHFRSHAAEREVAADVGVQHAPGRGGYSDVSDNGASRSEMRRRYTPRIFGTLVLYGLTRCAEEALTAFNCVPFASFRWDIVASIPGSLLGLLTTWMIARWVQCVDDLVFEIRAARFRLGAVAVTSSGALLSCNVVIIVFSAIDVSKHVVGLSPDVWMELTSFMQGTLYTFNGFAFFVLGIQLALFVSETSTIESSRAMKQNVLLVAAVFGFMCAFRGIILCIFAFSVAQPSKNLNSVVQSSWGSPLMLLIEWICLAVSLFVLQPAQTDAERANSAGVVPPGDDDARRIQGTSLASRRRIDSTSLETVRSQFRLTGGRGVADPEKQALFSQRFLDSSTSDGLGSVKAFP